MISDDRYANETDPHLVRHIYHQADDGERLLFYDIFLGLDGKLWLLAPLYATRWLDNGPKHKFIFDVEDQPVPLLTTDTREGYVSDILVRENAEHFYGTGLLYPRTHYFAGHAFLFEFDLRSQGDEPIELFFTVGKKRFRYRLYLPPAVQEQHAFVNTTLFRDDRWLLPDWLRHCTKLGFDWFILYDNASIDTPEDALAKHPNVRLIGWPYPYYYDYPDGSVEHWDNIHRLGSQIPQQMHALYKYGQTCRWMGFFDTDEYPNLIGFANLGQMLAQNGEKKAVMLGSVFYGGRKTPRARTIQSRYRYRTDLNEEQAFGRRKGLINLARLQPPEHMGVHDFADHEQDGSVMRREAFESKNWRQYPLDVARLNHYYMIGRGRRNDGGRDQLRQLYNYELDESILR